MSDITVTIEVSEGEAEFLRRCYAGREHYTTTARIAARVADALPDPDQELLHKMLVAYYEGMWSAGAATPGARTPQRQEAMKAILAVVREELSSE